jgi:hypothetical protein
LTLEIWYLTMPTPEITRGIEAHTELEEKLEISKVWRKFGGQWRTCARAEILLVYAKILF